MKKVISLVVVLSMVFLMVGCGSSNESASSTQTSQSSSQEQTPQDDGSKDEPSQADSSAVEQEKHVFMFKSSGNAFGDVMYRGFAEAVSSLGHIPEYHSPAETTAAAQVALVEELIAQGVSSITISANDGDAFNAVARLAEQNGVKLLSSDSAINADIRESHVIPAAIEDVGKHLVYAAVMILAEEPYVESMDMQAKTEEILANNTFTDQPIKIGILSATTTSPVQNQWIAAMEQEILRLDAAYPGNMDTTLDIKYGNDDAQDSVTQANAFISEDAVDIIVAPTTVGMFAAGQQLQGNPNSNIKLTGLGLPSEMANFMPSADEDDFDAVCPYMMLWDVEGLGAVSGAAAVAAANGEFDGEIGSTFEYNGQTYTAIEDPDSDGSVIAVGNPFVFYKGNVEEWKDIL